MTISILPDGWKRPKGFSNAIVAEGRQIYVAGQIGWDGDEVLVSDDFAAQAAQALRNIVTVLAAAGAEPHHIARMTWYVTDKQEYVTARREIGKAYREIIGDHYPAMTAIGVTALIEDGAKVEIEATAVVPPGPRE